MDLVKPLLRGTVITSNSYIRKEDRLQINGLSIHLKKLEKGEQINPKVRRRKAVIEIRVKISEIVSRRTIEKINETKAGPSRRSIEQPVFGGTDQERTRNDTSPASRMREVTSEWIPRML